MSPAAALATEPAAYVLDFTEGGREMAGLLGGKGANLAEMCRLGLPVPPGFTVTTEACRAFLATGEVPASLDAEVATHLATLEARTGRRLGDPDDPLLLSVRSGARYSMPGMMDTILDVGVCDATVAGLAAKAGDARFAWDCYRRLVQMFGTTVLGVEGEAFGALLERQQEVSGAATDLDLTADDLEAIVRASLALVEERTGAPFPQDPHVQLDQAIRAVFGSWNSPRAQVYRRQERLPADLGTAVNVMAMVFGNRGTGSCTGVGFTRDPATGERGAYGDVLLGAQGEDVVAGVRNTLPLHVLGDLMPGPYAELMAAMDTLEQHYRDLCDIEFTVEEGRLWMLQTRVGKRTPAAAFVIAHQLLQEGVITAEEALLRVRGRQLSQLLFPQLDRQPGTVLLAEGTGASPGAASGALVLDSATAVAWAAEGRRVVLVRRETNADDLAGMIAADGVLTSRGGKTSHAAVVARGMGRTCVCGAESLEVDVEARTVHVRDSGQVLREGDVISLDGTTGEVFAGDVPVSASLVERHLEGYGTDPGHPLLAAVDALLAIADEHRTLGVRANADNGPDTARARALGAEGVGLARTEHMFLGERRSLVEALVLADGPVAQQEALARLGELQEEDFVALLEAADGQPVTVRLIDPPLHEFLPDLTELTLEVERHRAAGEAWRSEELLGAVQRLHEQNPMLGLRGVRLALMIPGLLDMQVEALARAVVRRRAAGGDPRPELLVPLVAEAREVELARREVTAVLERVSAEAGEWVDLPVGTMIEVPRAALTADEIAPLVDFFSCGTNDLTQLTWGFSRDDVESSFLPRYLDLGIVPVSPFESLDRGGVGRLLRFAAEQGRGANPELEVGICGEHGGDPESIHLVHELGFDYVSCSPFRVPVARLEAGRAAIAAQDVTGGDV